MLPKIPLPGDWQPLLNHPAVADFLQSLSGNQAAEIFARKAEEAVSTSHPMAYYPVRDSEPPRWHVRFSGKTFLVESARGGLRASVAYPGGPDWFVRDKKAGERCVAFLSSLFPRHRTDPAHREAEPVL